MLNEFAIQTPEKTTPTKKIKNYEKCIVPIGQATKKLHF